MSQSIRSLIFNLFFYLTTFLYGLSCLILSFIPGRGAMMAGLRRYCHVMNWGMRVIAGIDIRVTGHENIPEDGPVIFASKHQSYGDGFVIFSQFTDLSFVTGDHLEKFWGLKRILQKANAVVIDSCGGSDSRTAMERQAEAVRREGRRLLIFPEGHLSKVGTQHMYRKGVWHLQEDFGCPVVPIANTLGQRWNQNAWAKHPGVAHIEFLEPIPAGLPKDVFMAQLESRIEGRSLALLDLEDLGALNPADMGRLEENEVARAKRLAREAESPTG